MTKLALKTIALGILTIVVGVLAVPLVIAAAKYIWSLFA